MSEGRRKPEKEGGGVSGKRLREAAFLVFGAAFSYLCVWLLAVCCLLLYADVFLNAERFSDAGLLLQKETSLSAELLSDAGTLAETFLGAAAGETADGASGEGSGEGEMENPGAGAYLPVGWRDGVRATAAGAALWAVSYFAALLRNAPRKRRDAEMGGAAGMPRGAEGQDPACPQRRESLRRLAWRLAPLALRLSAAGCFLWQLVRRRGEIRAGLCLLADLVIGGWNAFYGTKIPSFAPSVSHGGGIVGGGISADAGTALLFLLLALFWWESACILRWKKAALAVLPGACVLSLGLLVGYAPGQAALLCFALGSVFALLLCGKGDRRACGRGGSGAPVTALQGMGGLYLLFAALLCVSAAGLFGERAEGLALAYQGKADAWQRGLEDGLSDLTLAGFFGDDDGKVSNRAPRYRGKEVMTVHVSALPEDAVYLRGFVGDAYENGTWGSAGGEDASGQSALGAAGQPSLAAGQPLPGAAGRPSLAAGQPLPGAAGRPSLAAGQPSLAAGQPSDAAALPLALGSGETVTFWLDYLDKGDGYAYLPYYIDMASVTAEDGSLLAEAGYFLRDGCGGVTAEGLRENAPLGQRPDQSDSGAARGEAALTGEERARFLAVPEELTRFGELGEELSDELALFCRAAGVEWQEDGLLRCQLALYMVREALSGTEYSLDLDPVPRGEDVAEYFLFVSKKGFCQQYATAGTLLLREMGVMARYATGFYVPLGRFERQADGTYLAVVSDSDAHAWAEVYVAGLGWVPAEVTKGIGAGAAQEGQGEAAGQAEDPAAERPGAAQGAETPDGAKVGEGSAGAGGNGAEAGEGSAGAGGNGAENQESGAEGNAASGGAETPGGGAFAAGAGADGETDGQKTAGAADGSGAGTGNEGTNPGGAGNPLGKPMFWLAAVIAFLGGFAWGFLCGGRIPCGKPFRRKTAGGPSGGAGIPRAPGRKEDGSLRPAQGASDGRTGNALPARCLRKYRGDTRRAVLDISRKVSEVLRRRGIVRAAGPDDRGFKEQAREKIALPKQEVERYLSIAERAAFGESAPSVEEAEFCGAFYRKIKRRAKKRDAGIL